MRRAHLLIFLALGLVSFAPSHPRVQVFGTVVDSITGKPVYACTVEHHDLDGKRWSLTSVNSDGRYAMFVPADEPFELWVVRENGYKELHQRFAAVPAGTATFEADLRLAPK